MKTTRLDVVRDRNGQPMTNFRGQQVFIKDGVYFAMSPDQQADIVRLIKSLGNLPEEI